VRTLLHELSRRRVFRVAGIYGVVSWVLTEVADVIFPALQLPDWTITFVVALLILGFPIAMIFAWVFDIGIERTEPLKERTRGVPYLERFGYLILLLVAMGVLAYLLLPKDLWTSAPEEVAGPRNSIAVLPFANLSDDPSNDYFSDGMSEELLNLLARAPDLHVASRTSSFAFKDKNLDVREVARQLGVETVLEGSVRRDGDRVRITAQLIDAETGYHLWSNTYDRELKDIFAVQDDISGEIVKALKITLGGPGEEVPVMARAAPPTQDVEAYQLYLQARHQWKRRGDKAVRRSIELLQQAVDKDPDFARAYSGLAAAYVVLPGYAREEPEPYLIKATEAAQQALSRDPNLAEAHAVLAEVAMFEKHWTDAEAGFFFATSLDHNDPTAHQWYSLLLRQTGRLDKALEEAKLALDLDPASPIVNANVAETYATLGYDEKALQYRQAAVDLGYDSAMDDDLSTRMEIIRSGDQARLREMLLQTKGPDGQIIFTEELADAVIRVRNDPATWPELEAVLAKTAPEVPEYVWFDFYLLAGRENKAMELALEYPDNVEVTMIWMPEAVDFRRLPRFGELAEKLGLMDYWKQYGWPDDCRPVGAGMQCGFSTLVATR